MEDRIAVMDTVQISSTAKEKSNRYLSTKQLEDIIRNGEGYVCRRTSPNHEGLYNDNKFIMRGKFYGKKLDIVFAVNDENIGVITQMSQHADTYKGRFYQKVGDSVKDAVEYMEGRTESG